MKTGLNDSVVPKHGTMTQGGAMDQEIINELESILKGLRKIRKETWGNPDTDKRLLPLDEEIAVLEEVVNQMTYKGGWNGCHPVGQS